MNLLGKKARDKVTGFEGIIVGQASYLYSHPQCQVSNNNGKSDDFAEVWIYEERLEIFDE